MATFFMFGSYPVEVLEEISAERTESAAAVIKTNGGELKSAYALLGEYDVVLIVELPDTEHAMKTSIDLAKLTGISFTTAPAVSVENFDKIMEE